MSALKENIYCISGLGSDERAFERLQIDGYGLNYLECITPLKKESLASYAKRMSAWVRETNPVIIGLSFGGVVAIEIAKHIPVQKLILISAVKTTSEIPRWMRVSGALKLHRILPVKSNRFTERADDKRIGIQTAEEKTLVEQYRKNADQAFLDWGIDQILNWRNNWIPQNTYHIHGTDDRMFPIRNIQPTHIVKEGTHIMIWNRAEEISRHILQILSGN